MKRLTSAAAAPTAGGSAYAQYTQTYSQTFQYDGFGNLTEKVLNGTAAPIPVNAASNQLTNAYYDANGNMTSGAGASFTYDEANRMSSATETSGGQEKYGYDPANKRVYRMDTNGAEWYTFYGAKGEKLGKYSIYQASCSYARSGPCTYQFYPQGTSIWFAGRPILDLGGSVMQDRLGSNTTVPYLPYGDGGSANDQLGFATYTQDSYTGLDYANQRFYASTYGNFTSPDPSMDNVDYSNPISWNAYAYTMGDPINSNDPSGLVTCGDLINSSDDLSLNSIMTTYNSLGYLAQTIWHEAGPMYNSDVANPSNFETEQGYIATALMNRYNIANWGLTAYTSTGGTVNPALFGGLGTSLTSVVLQAAGNNQSWGIYTNGKLNNMSTLQQVLNANISVGPQVDVQAGNAASAVGATCYAALDAVTQAIEALDGTVTEPAGVILTYWNLAANSSPAAGTQTVQKIRPNGNTFYGYFSTPQPKPVRRPPPRRPRR